MSLNYSSITLSHSKYKCTSKVKNENKLMKKQQHRIEIQCRELQTTKIIKKTAKLYFLAKPTHLRMSQEWQYTCTRVRQIFYPISLYLQLVLIQFWRKIMMIVVMIENWRKQQLHIGRQRNWRHIYYHWSTPTLSTPWIIWKWLTYCSWGNSNPINKLRMNVLIWSRLVGRLVWKRCREVKHK